MSYRNWTPEEDAIIAKMRDEGHSSGAIAAALGDVSRSAVCGRAYRLRQSGYNLPNARYTLRALAIAEAKKKGGEPWRPMAPKPATVLPISAPQSELAFPAILWQAPATVEPKRRASNVTIFDLGRCMCRKPLWEDHESLPVEEKFYCGASTQGGPWCSEHRSGIFTGAASAERQPTPVQDLAA